MAPRVFWIDAPVQGRLAIMARPLGGERLHDEIAHLKSEGVTALVSLLEADESRELALDDEASACAAHDLAFHAFPIADRGVPADSEKLVALVDALAGSLRVGASIAIHCRAGIGRSSLLAAAVLVRCGLAPDVALARISAARGLAVPDTDEQRTWILRLETH